MGGACGYTHYQLSNMLPLLQAAEGILHIRAVKVARRLDGLQETRRYKCYNSVQEAVLMSVGSPGYSSV